MTTISRPMHLTDSARPARSTLSGLLAACRLEDGARWALAGAGVAAAILILLAV